MEAKEVQSMPNKNGGKNKDDAMKTRGRTGRMRKKQRGRVNVKWELIKKMTKLQGKCGKQARKRK